MNNKKAIYCSGFFVIFVLALAIAFFLFPKQSSHAEATIQKNEDVNSKGTDNLLVKDFVVTETSTEDISKPREITPKLPMSETEDLELLIEPGFFTKPWEQKLETLEDIIDVSIVEIAEPCEFSIEFNPAPDQTFRCVSIINSYMNNSEESFSQMVTDSSVSIKSDTHGDILVEHEMSPLWGLTAGAELPELTNQPAVSRQFVVRDGGLYLSQQVDNEQKIEDTQYFDGNIEQFILDLPTDFVPKKGYQWEVNRVKPYPYKAACTLVGFAEVHGVKTAKIHSQTELIGVKVPGSGPARTMNISTDTYVELGTGIVMRTESEFGAREAGVDFKMKSYSQTIPVHQ